MSSSQELLEQVRQAQLPYNSEEWQQYDRQLSQMVRECYPQVKEDMGWLDKKDFWVRVIQYHYYRYGLGIWRQLMGDEGLAPFIREQIKEWHGNMQSFIKTTLKDLLEKAKWKKLKELF